MRSDAFDQQRELRMKEGRRGERVRERGAAAAAGGGGKRRIWG